MRTLGLLLGLGAGITACGGTPAVAEPGSVASCGQEPVFGAPALPYTAPRSRFGSLIRANPASLARELGRQVPRVLAEEKGRSIGAPGKVSYTLHRGDFSFHSSEDAFSVRTRLTADVEVCKPFGALCARYGTCRPEWQVDVTLPLPLPLAEPPEPRTRVAVTQGCVLRPIGYNATPELESITQREARRFQDQVRSRFRQAHQRWLKEWHATAKPVRFGDGESDCATFTLETLKHSPVEQNDTELTLAFEASGLVSLSCEPATDRALPKVALDPQFAPSMDLAVAHELALDEITRALNEQLTRSPNRAGGSIELRAGQNDGNPALFAGLQGFGECAVEWTKVIPRLKDAALLLEPAPGAPASPGRRWLAEHGRVPLPAEWRSLREQLPELSQRLLDTATTRERALPIELSSDLQPGERVQIHATSMALVLSLHGSLTASLP